MAKKKPAPRNRVTKRPRIPVVSLVDLPNKGMDTPSRRPIRTGALSDRRASQGQRIVGGRITGLNRLENLRLRRGQAATVINRSPKHTNQGKGGRARQTNVTTGKRKK